MKKKPMTQAERARNYRLRKKLKLAGDRPADVYLFTGHLTQPGLDKLAELALQGVTLDRAALTLGTTEGELRALMPVGSKVRALWLDGYRKFIEGLDEQSRQKALKGHSP